MRRTLALALACALALAGCGGHHKHHTPTRTVDGHACNPADYAMPCALPAPVASDIATGALSVSAIPGADFGWSAVTADQAVAHGWGFVASYLSHDLAKNFTRSAVAAFHARHVATVLVWETLADRALSGYLGGIVDAHAALAQAYALGAPVGVHIDFAIDFDASGPDVAPYFAGVHSVLGTSEGDYGGAGPTSWLCAHHLAFTSWATYAWLGRTGGLWPSIACAPLRQVLNGSSYDLDQAFAPFYGQFPVTDPKPPRHAVHCWGRHYHPRHHAKVCDTIRPRVSHWSQTRNLARGRARHAESILRARRCVKPYRRSACIRQGRKDRHERRWQRAFARRIHHAFALYG